MSRQPRKREQPSLSEINATLLTCSLCAVLAHVCYPEQGDFHAMFIPVALAFAAVGGTWHSLGLIWRDVKLRRKLKEREKTSDSYGTAREATWREIVDRGMSDPTTGALLGLFKGAFPVFWPANVPFSLIEMPPGAGKTIRLVIGSIFHYAFLGQTLIVADVKGELVAICLRALRRLGFDAIAVDPGKVTDDDIPTVEFNMFQAVLDAMFADGEARKDAITAARDFATLLMPQRKSGGKEDYFLAGAMRTIVIGIIYLAFTNPSRCTPSRCFDLLNNATTFKDALRFIRDHLRSLEADDPVLVFLKSEAASLLALWKDNPENLSSFLQWATQALGPFNQAGRLAGYGEDEFFDFGELRDRPRIVFVVSPLTHMRDFESVTSLFNYNVIAAAKRNPSGNPVRLIADEALNYKISPDLASDMETMRGLRVFADLYIQSFSGLVRKLGKESAEAIADYCDIKIFSGINSHERSKAVSDYLSDQTVRSEDFSHHHDDLDLSYSSKEHARKLATPDEILAMPKGMGWVVAQGLRPMKLAFPHFGEVEPWATIADQNPLEHGRLTGKIKLTLKYPEAGMHTAVSVEGIDYRAAEYGEKAAWRKGLFAAGRYFIWVPVFASVMAFSATAGTPHVLFQYQYVGSGAAKFYTRCTYAGLQSQTVSSVDGRCPAVRLLTQKH